MLGIDDHFKQIQVGIAVRVCQVLMGWPVKVRDFASFIDQSYTRVKMLQEHLLVEIREFDRMLFFKSDRSDPCSYRQATHGEGDKLLTVENPPASGDRLKRVALLNRSVRLAEKEISAGQQRDGE